MKQPRATVQCSDVSKDWTPKDEDKDKDLTLKDKDRGTSIGIGASMQYIGELNNVIEWISNIFSWPV